VSFNVGVVFACSTNDIMLTQDHGDNSLLLLLVIFTCLLATQQASHGVSQSKASAMWMIWRNLFQEAPGANTSGQWHQHRDCSDNLLRDL